MNANGAHAVGDIDAALRAAIPEPALRNLFLGYLDRRQSAEMTIMYWMKALPDVDALRSRLDASLACCKRLDANEAALGAASLRALVDDNAEGCERIAQMLRSGVDSDRPAPSVDEGIAFCKNLFEWSVQQSDASSVALYSLGNPTILENATREIVDLLRGYGVLGVGCDALEIGCGIGRFQQALAPHGKWVTGIDLAANMIAAARLRCAGIPNVTLAECTGRDLSMFDADRFNLVFSVDAFPYLHQSGMALVETHFHEARRVLRPGGHLVILEFSYRGDVALDRIDVARLSASCGFNARVNGSQPFSLWDGAAFHLVSTK